MRDRTAVRTYSPQAEEFRRRHEHHRAWGLAQRHAERLRQLRASRTDGPPPAVGERVSSPPPTVREQVASPPPTVREQIPSPPPAVGEQISSPPPAVGEQVSSLPPTVREQISGPPSSGDTPRQRTAREQISSPPPSGEMSHRYTERSTARTVSASNNTAADAGRPQRLPGETACDQVPGRRTAIAWWHAARPATVDDGRIIVVLDDAAVEVRSTDNSATNPVAPPGRHPNANAHTHQHPFCIGGHPGQGRILGSSAERARNRVKPVRVTVRNHDRHCAQSQNRPDGERPDVDISAFSLRTKTSDFLPGDHIGRARTVDAAGASVRGPPWVIYAAMGHIRRAHTAQPARHIRSRVAVSWRQPRALSPRLG